MISTITNSLVLLLLLPSQSFGFAPLSSSIATKINTKSNVLYSSPFDDTPSPLDEESSDASPFDSYTLGTSTDIVSKDTVTGSGITAETEDVLTVALVGKVIQTGREFLNNEDYTFQLGSGETFPGFNEGLLGSSVGTKRTIKVPPNKAYGKKGARGIPPMSDLMFEVEVKAVARSPFERIIAKIGTDRLAGFAALIAFLAISPYLPTSLPSF